MATLVIETDLGHDPDDLFAVCHAVEAGHRVVALALTPGSPEQVRLASGLRRRLGLECEVGVAKPAAKPERLGVHDRLMGRLGFPPADPPDGTSAEVVNRALDRHPDAELLLIGPAPGTRAALAGRPVPRLTFQGGFLPYTLHRPAVTAPDFEGKDWVPTFNFNGDRKAVDAVLAAGVGRRQFCGKNVCHTVRIDAERRRQMAPARSLAGEVYLLALDLYFETHEAKKLHDPTALVCHLRPEVGVWFRGRPVRREGGWTTEADPAGDFVLADVDRDALWRHLLGRT